MIITALLHMVCHRSENVWLVTDRDPYDAYCYVERQFDQAAARPSADLAEGLRADIVCLQEIKCVDEAFPREAIEALGYNVVTHGQKTFNGVALLSKLPFDETTPRLAETTKTSTLVSGRRGHAKQGVLRVACLYLPNGNPPETEKYPYKLKWMSRLLEYQSNG